MKPWARKLKEKIDSDECTFAPDGTWGVYCIIHDYDYRRGKRVRDKIEADLRLMRGIASEGYPIVGFVYFLGVSTFGWIAWFKHRWKR